MGNSNSQHGAGSVHPVHPSGRVWSQSLEIPPEHQRNRMKRGYFPPPNGRSGYHLQPRAYAPPQKVLPTLSPQKGALRLKPTSNGAILHGGGTISGKKLLAEIEAQEIKVQSEAPAPTKSGASWKMKSGVQKSSEAKEKPSSNNSHNLQNSHNVQNMKDSSNGDPQTENKNSRKSSGTDNGSLNGKLNGNVLTTASINPSNVNSTSNTPALLRRRGSEQSEISISSQLSRELTEEDETRDRSTSPVPNTFTILSESPAKKQIRSRKKYAAPPPPEVEVKEKVQTRLFKTQSSQKEEAKLLENIRKEEAKLFENIRKEEAKILANLNKSGGGEFKRDFHKPGEFKSPSRISAGDLKKTDLKNKDLNQELKNQNLRRDLKNGDLRREKNGELKKPEYKSSSPAINSLTLTLEELEAEEAKEKKTFYFGEEQKVKKSKSSSALGSNLPQLENEKRKEENSEGKKQRKMKQPKGESKEDSNEDEKLNSSSSEMSSNSDIDIPMHIRPTLPARRPDLPRFSPTAAWRSLEIDCDDFKIPVRVQKLHGRNDSLSSGEISRRGGRGSLERSGDSGISAGDGGSPAHPNLNDDEELTHARARLGHRPAVSSFWTPEQDLDESSSEFEGEDLIPVATKQSSAAAMLLPSGLRTPPKFTTRSHLFGNSDSEGTGSGSGRMAVYSKRGNNGGKPSVASLKKKHLKRNNNSNFRLHQSTNNSLLDEEEEIPNGIRNSKLNNLYEDDFEDQLDCNWFLSRSEPSSLHLIGKRRNSRSLHQLSLVGNSFEENEEEMREVRSEIGYGPSSMNFLNYSAKTRSEKIHSNIHGNQPHVNLHGNKIHGNYIHSNQLNHLINQEENSEDENGEVHPGGSNSLNLFPRPFSHIMYLPAYESRRVPTTLTRRAKSVDHLDHQEIIFNKSKSRPAQRQRSHSPEGEMNRNLINRNTVEQMKEQLEARARMSEKEKKKKFKFQSTLRVLERKAIEVSLAREAEERENERLREIEAMRRVEEEFQKKRAKEKMEFQKAAASIANSKPNSTTFNFTTANGPNFSPLLNNGGNGQNKNSPQNLGVQNLNQVHILNHGQNLNLQNLNNGQNLNNRKTNIAQSRDLKPQKEAEIEHRVFQKPSHLKAEKAGNYIGTKKVEEMNLNLGGGFGRRCEPDGAPAVVDIRREMIQASRKRSGNTNPSEMTQELSEFKQETRQYCEYRKSPRNSPARLHENNKKNGSDIYPVRSSSSDLGGQKSSRCSGSGMSQISHSQLQGGRYRSTIHPEIVCDIPVKPLPYMVNFSRLSGSTSNLLEESRPGSGMSNGGSQLGKSDNYRRDWANHKGMLGGMGPRAASITSLHSGGLSPNANLRSSSTDLTVESPNQFHKKKIVLHQKYSSSPSSSPIPSVKIHVNGNSHSYSGSSTGVESNCEPEKESKHSKLIVRGPTENSILNPSPAAGISGFNVTPFRPSGSSAYRPVAFSPSKGSKIEVISSNGHQQQNFPSVTTVI